MNIVFAQQPLPRLVESGSIFLAGPTPRSTNPVPSWRPHAIEQLHTLGFTGIVFNPEVEGGAWEDEYDAQVEWEHAALHMADVIVFWVPRDMQAMPAMTTNSEFGIWQASGKCVWGSPKGAPKTRYQIHHAHKADVPVFDTLEDTLAEAVRRIGSGATRREGECSVPLHLWREPSFQAWYRAQLEVGNRLDGGHVEWTFRVGAAGGRIFAWAYKAQVHVAAEGRTKDNEFVLARPDVASVLMYRKGRSILDTEVVLVREFRTAGRTPDGFTWELPGGSSLNPEASMQEVAIAEVAEETGVTLRPCDLAYVRSRQAAPTLSAHHVHLYTAVLGPEHGGHLKAAAGRSHGVAEEGERTWVESMTVREMLANPSVDWSTIGMVMNVLADRML
jgi:8-oxo-dGTP pyrophosphatase MutT (NUDIX family)